MNETKGTATVEVEYMTRFLTLVKVTQTLDGKTRTWFGAVRDWKSFKEAMEEGKPWREIPADAVNILPYFQDENGKYFVVLALENRALVNSWILSTPAGLVEIRKNQDLIDQLREQGVSEEEIAKQLEKEAAGRELMEELGASSVEGKTEFLGKGFTSVGLTSESMGFFTMQVKDIKNASLDADEIIKGVVLSLDDVPKIMNGEKLPLKDANGEVVCDKNGEPITSYELDVKFIASVGQFYEKVKREEAEKRAERAEQRVRKLEELLKGAKALLEQNAGSHTSAQPVQSPRSKNNGNGDGKAGK